MNEEKPTPNGGQTTRLLTPKEGFGRIRAGHTKGYSLLASGEIESLKIGGSRLIPEDSLQRYIDRKLAEEKEKQRIISGDAPR